VAREETSLTIFSESLRRVIDIEASDPPIHTSTLTTSFYMGLSRPRARAFCGFREVVPPVMYAVARAGSFPFRW
jgi:hypothetical protein